MPKVEITEELLTKSITEKAALLRLRINPVDAGILAREILTDLVPNQDSFSPGEQIIWMHGYDYEKWAPCRGVVIMFQKGATKVQIEYLSTLWDSAGETKKSMVYPSQLRKVTPDQLDAELQAKPPSELQVRQAEAVLRAAQSSAGPEDAPVAPSGEPGQPVINPDVPSGTPLTAPAEDPPAEVETPEEPLAAGPTV